MKDGNHSSRPSFLADLGYFVVVGAVGIVGAFLIFKYGWALALIFT